MQEQFTNQYNLHLIIIQLYNIFQKLFNQKLLTSDRILNI
jgi:hypothetical protein